MLRTIAKVVRVPIIWVLVISAYRTFRAGGAQSFSPPGTWGLAGLSCFSPQAPLRLAGLGQFNPHVLWGLKPPNHRTDVSLTGSRGLGLAFLGYVRLIFMGIVKYRKTYFIWFGPLTR